ncbi:MAG TPA: hypothetical protein VJ861_01865 [Treponemataceae bacterium]|nr:hypothetical protein [Treponemataceae bacterium]
MTKRLLPVLLVFLSINTVLIAQELPMVAVYSLVSIDTTETVRRTVNDLVFSFIREQRNYRVLDMRKDSLPEDLSIPAGSDYIFYGNLINRTDGIKLELVLKGGMYNTTRLLSRVYENSNRILLESRMLVRDLFDQSVALPEPEFVEIPQVVSLIDSESYGFEDNLLQVKNIDSLSGSWRGGEGIEKVMILRGGRGVAIFDSGISISLELIIGNNELFIKQKGPLSIRQFLNLPDLVAQQAVSIVPPLEWRFRVTPDFKKLVGVNKTVSIKHDGKNILSMENIEVKTVWLRE